MKKILSIILLFIFSNSTQAQVNQASTTSFTTPSKSIFSPERKRNFSRKGNFYFHWGYNNSWYQNSDINFKGPGYDFTIKDVTAQDRQSKLSWDYLNPAEISIPQYNIRIGYFIKDNYSISVGWDHMKYVVDIPQTVIIEGNIGSNISVPNTPTGSYAGTYDGQYINLNDQVLSYEHTDGFNYANVELERHDDIWVAPSQKTSLTLESGLGTGLFIPRSDVRLFGMGRNHNFNVAGYGFSAKLGLKFFITKGWFIQNTTKIGTAKLTNVRTTGFNDVDKAQQRINYLENMVVMGFQL